MKNLKDALKESHRAYIFDNTHTSANLIAEITDGENVVINSVIDTPSWVIDYIS